MLLMFLIEKDDDLLTECGSLKSDFNCLCVEFQNILFEQNEEELDCVKNEGKSILEKILNK